MTHFELVRKELQENGFEIDAETTVSEGNRVYLVMSARYSGTVSQKPAHWIYLGNLLNSTKKSDRQYVEKIIKTLRVKAEFCDDKEVIEALRSIENAKSN